MIRGDRAYRVTGKRDREVYISFTVHGPDPAGGINGPVLADLNDRQFDVDADGNFELILSPDERPGNSVVLPPDVRIVLVRSYFLAEQSAQNDPTTHVQLHIEPLDDPVPHPHSTTPRSRSACSTPSPSCGRRRSASVCSASRTRRRCRSWRTSPTRSARRGASATPASPPREPSTSSTRRATFDLQPDEALVMEGTMPECDFANLVLWNPHMQTLEYRSRRSALNSAQMELGDGGAFRIVISERDPGVANWIDTGGHRRGTMFWRFLLPKEDPARRSAGSSR